MCISQITRNRTAQQPREDSLTKTQYHQEQCLGELQDRQPCHSKEAEPCLQTNDGLSRESLQLPSPPQHAHPAAIGMPHLAHEPPAAPCLAESVPAVATTSTCAARSDAGGEPTCHAPGTLPAARAAGASSPPNALSHLMQRQRERRQHVTFFLELEPDGNWRWHWWAKSPPAGTPARIGTGSSSCDPSSQGLPAWQYVASTQAEGPCDGGGPSYQQSAALRAEGLSQDPVSASSTQLQGLQSNAVDVTHQHCGAHISATNSPAVAAGGGSCDGSIAKAGVALERGSGPTLGARQLETAWAASTELGADKMGMGGGRGDKVELSLFACRAHRLGCIRHRAALARYDRLCQILPAKYFVLPC